MCTPQLPPLQQFFLYCNLIMIIIWKKKPHFLHYHNGISTWCIQLFWILSYSLPGAPVVSRELMHRGHCPGTAPGLWVERKECTRCVGQSLNWVETFLEYQCSLSVSHCSLTHIYLLPHPTHLSCPSFSVSLHVTSQTHFLLTPGQVMKMNKVDWPSGQGGAGESSRGLI